MLRNADRTHGTPSRVVILASILWLGFSSFVQGGQNQTKTLATPTPGQVAWQDMELGMFIHFGLWSWPQEEGAGLYAKKGVDDIQIFNPTKLDTDQWVRVAESMGAKYIVITAKHGDGFCMWQTDTTDFSVKNTPWRGGKGDILADLAESCRKRGIKLGVYLNPRNAQRDVNDGGRAVDPAKQDEYDRFYRRQLTEVLSRYGRMSEVWFDGGCRIEVGDILKKHAPDAMVLQSPQTTLRWVGNEAGHCPYPAWNTVHSDRPPKKHGVYTAVDGDPAGDRWMPLECDARIRKGWMYRADNEHTLKTVDALLDMYYNSVGRGAVLLLNHTPDTTGRIPEADARRAAEFGAEVRRRFGKSLAETSHEGRTVLLDLDKPTFVDHAVTMEDIIHGERIRRYTIEGFVDGHWKTLGRGTAVGHKRIDRFPLVKVSKLRFRAEESVGVPKLRKFAVYRVDRIPEPPVAEPAQQTKEINLIVVAGQSNCAGFDTVLEDLMPEPIDKEVLFMFDVGGSPIYDNGFHNASSYGEWTTLRAQPNGVPYVKDGKIEKYTFRTKTGGFGPEISIARTLYNNGMRNLAVLKFAFATTSFARKHWTLGGGLNRAFMARYKVAVEKLQKRGYTVRVRAVFWHQGESDTGNPKFPEQFMAFVHDLRSRWGNERLPFITSVSTPDYWLWTGEVTDKEREQRNKGVGAVHVAIAQRDPHIHYVDDRGCQRSEICGHYSSEGTLEIGHRMVKKYLEVYGPKK